MQNIDLTLVINKTESLFRRDPIDFTIVTKELSPDVKDLFDSEPYLVTVKTDGSCGMVCQMDDHSYQLLRRQDIKLNSRNYQSIMNYGTTRIMAGLPCYVSTMVRGTGKSERTVPVYIFQLDQIGKPEIENKHIIGFTPLLHDFGDDKYAISAIDGTNGDPNMKLFTTVFTGSLNIHVKFIPVAELMAHQMLMTVEIMGSKISNKYGFTDDQHFINPHGSIVYPPEEYPSKLDSLDAIKEWFQTDHINRWADVEGFVIYFPKINRRFKFHRGHAGMESTWYQKKTSGLSFIFNY